MLKRIGLTLLTVFVVESFGVSTSNAQSGETAVPAPSAPVGYVTVEEDRWYLMADEPGKNLARAREAYLMFDERTAARELRKAAVQIRLSASNAAGATRRSLMRYEHELEHAAKRIEDGTLHTVDELDVVAARALHSLSEYHYIKAEQAWRKKKLEQAGYYLRASADNIERAAAKTESQIRATTAEVAHESRLISGTLIEGSGYIFDNVGAGFERIGHQIEHVGSNLIAPHERSVENR